MLRNEWHNEKVNSREVIPDTLFSYYVKYGTDKAASEYDLVYAPIFDPIRQSVTNVLEIGVGSVSGTHPSSFSGIVAHNNFYTPGGSLRAWRDYFPNAFINGVDVAEDCLLKEDRIETFLFDSQDKNLCDAHFEDEKFDIIVDDGLHTAKAQIKTLYNFFNKVKIGGYYVIEDVGGGGDNSCLRTEFKEELDKIFDCCEEINDRSNVIVLKKKNTLDLSTTESKEAVETDKINDSNLTIVSGLWDIGREGRDFSLYEEHFDKFLKIPCNMVLFIPRSLEDFVWSRRSANNTYVKILELEGVKQMFSPFWDKWQLIRNSESWQNQTGEGGWLKQSPQCVNEYYNPIVMSKMFMLHDSKCWNVFDDDYLIWLDAGISQTVYENYFYREENLKEITKHIKPFLFLSYPYEAVNEIHGFDFEAMNRFADKKVEYVCRGGLFGGHRDFLSEANTEYYSILNNTLSQGYAGTEESVFSILANLYPQNYRRYALDGNGLIVKFMQAIDAGEVELEKVEESINRQFKSTVRDISSVKTNLYFLTFNYAEQLEYTIKSLQNHNGFLDHSYQKIVIDNSTDEQARIDNKNVCDKYGFEHIIRGENTGINGGRQFAAEHFHESDADFYLFFEDDMTLSLPDEENYCRNGLRKYIPDLYLKLHQIMLKEEFDFLKLSFTEVFMDNNMQTSWYNVPQEIRDRDWPDYSKLPTTGLDPYSPRTIFRNIERLEYGLCYIDGEVYYSNWPMIVSKEGNKKMFIETKWAYPYEQTWMSYMYQETKKGNLKPAVLLASPVTHERFKFYKSEDRREC